MKRFVKESFGLTDSGARAVMRAAGISFLTNCGYMVFMLLAMYFGDNVLRGVRKPAWFYLILLAVTLVFVYIAVDQEYVKTYNATYEEAAQLRFEIADHIRELPLSYFFTHDLSDLAQTIMQDVTEIEHAMSHSIPRCIAAVGFLTVVSILLIITEPVLGLAAVIPLAGGLLLMLLSKNMQRRWTAKYFLRGRETSEAFQETIELQKEIKSCGLEEDNYRKVSARLGDSEKIRIRSELTQAWPLLLSTSIMKLTLGTVSIAAAGLLKADAVQLIYVIGFLLASIRLVDAVGALEENFAELFYLDARVRRINELRNTKTQQGKDRKLTHFDICVEDVSFGYNEELTVVNGASFTAGQGKVTAIVGPSGCGKSTLLRLVSRLYDYEGGKISIDGKDIRDISTDSLFEQISFVFQDVILFNATILDNIRMGRSGATDEEVKTAARMANCEDFILKLPQGYETKIGENGSRLSGGERQRISIARAFLKDAPILLLDEISASLDVENERKIQEALNHLTEGKTVIIVSHRLKSVENVDQIVVMNEGRVEAAGTHKQLMQNCGLYRKLVEKSGMTEAFVY